MSKIAIYPGSFDPITYGHLDIIKRAASIFDKVIVAVALNTRKKTLFTAKERMDMLKKATLGLKNVQVQSFNGLVIEFAKKKKAKIIIRGIRVISDFEYEFQMALTNRRLNQNIETLFLMPSEGYSFISSALIKEAGLLGADLKSFVPGFVERELKKRLKV